jgi:hypothetical protein
VSTADERFFFVHLQKTAGTSLVKRVQAQFPMRAVYPNGSDGDIVACVISVEHLLERWAARGDEIRFVSGHFPLCVTELLGGGFRTLTVLRDPLERTLSYLRHHRQRTEADAALSLEAVYDDEFRFHGLVHNHMTKMLSLLPEEMDAGALTRVEFDRERLERAKRRLSEVDAVGLQDDFEAFCDEVSRRFGWRLGEPVRMNVTEPVEPAAELRERILADNAFDVELYEFACELVAGRAVAPG